MRVGDSIPGSGGVNETPPVPPLTPGEQADADVAWLKDYMSHHDDPKYMAAHAKEALDKYNDLENLHTYHPIDFSNSATSFLLWTEHSHVYVPYNRDGHSEEEVGLSFAAAIKELGGDPSAGPTTKYQDASSLKALDELWDHPPS